MDVPLRGAQCNPKSGRLQSDLHSWLIGRRRERERGKEEDEMSSVRPSVRRRDKKLAESPIRETEREGQIQKSNSGAQSGSFYSLFDRNANKQCESSKWRIDNEDLCLLNALDPKTERDP